MTKSSYWQLFYSSLTVLRSMALLCIAVFSVTSCAYSDNGQQGTQRNSESKFVGVVSKAQLNDKYAKFLQNYEGYQPSEQELNAVTTLSDKVSLTVFFGVWCHDSEREVPRLLKTFNTSSTSIELVALDTQKSDPQQLAEASSIKFTPTFVVFENGQEIGRIIERPQQSLAEDILKIWQDTNSPQ